jgi:hypothetical protein
MEPVDALMALVQFLVSIAICVLPIVLVLGAIVVLVVVLARRKPQEAPRTKATAKPKPTAEPKPTAKPKPAAEVEAASSTKAVTVEEIAMKSCSSCGADNPADNAFCEYCGASMAEE